MPTHTEIKDLPYTCESVFDLVIDIRKYPEFLPWCLDINITKEVPGIIVADMTIGFKFFRENFTSRVHYIKPKSINVIYEKGPFEYLVNEWNFEQISNRKTRIRFHVDFEFRSIIFKKAMGIIFSEAVRKMVSAFETRAAELNE
ncbi:MAG: ubiquinone-binding protein [Magnetovibrio sp.]|nr:ubiquinone-binding protein [Magnetovibrio sp.]|tara:strand:+ start:94 stop:525 length:432 start_codon:yes stop_codon:yes gene_type:complete